MPKASQLTADERLALILESFHSEQSIADLCRKH
jgi:transposase-like protein